MRPPDGGGRVQQEAVRPGGAAGQPTQGPAQRRVRGDEGFVLICNDGVLIQDSETSQ